MQEFYSSERHNFENEKALSEILKATHRHVEYPITLHGADHFGIATYTTYPILKKEVLYFDQKTANVCIYTDLLINSDTVRVFNCHLQSVRFGAEEYKFLESLGQAEEEQTVKRTRSILSRLRTAFIKRAAQADLISKTIAESPYPVIVCGDFNDTPLSYTYKKISENLLDAFRESGNGFGTSYAGPIPGLRIDYLLHSADFISYKYHTLKVKLSDHYPVEASLILNLKK
jgi:endonuclease/exonuclease/phosphatase family metal-dependent hydrolase